MLTQEDIQDECTAECGLQNCVCSQNYCITKKKIHLDKLVICLYLCLKFDLKNPGSSFDFLTESFIVLPTSSNKYVGGYIRPDNYVYLISSQAFSKD